MTGKLKVVARDLSMAANRKGKRPKIKHEGALKGIEKYLAEFQTHYTNMVNSQEYRSPDEADWEREDRLRVSGFPYCGLKHAYKRLNGDEEEAEEEVTFGMKYYTSVGTQTHRYIQYVLGHGAQMLGLWKCVTPKCPGTGDKAGFDNICPHCKRPMDYEEFTVKRGKNLSGHIDGVWRAADGKFFIVDYKTSSVKAISENDKWKHMPYKKNVAQIMAYVALLESEFGIKIEGWILFYIARDNPMMVSAPFGGIVNQRMKKKLLAKIDEWDRHYGLVMNAVRFSDLVTLIEEKPCKDYEWYSKSAYHSNFQPCPLGGSGICFNPEKLRKTMKRDWKLRPKNFLTHKRPKYLGPAPKPPKEK